MRRHTEKLHRRGWPGVLFTDLAAVLLLIGGCAGLGVRTEGTSGLLAWRVTDLRVETRESQGKTLDGRAFTVVITNISDRTLTLTKMDETRSQPGTGTSFATYPIRWELAPGAERKIPRFSTLVCRSPAGCTDSGGAQPMFQIDFEGVDDQKRPIAARLDITLPPEASGRAPNVTQPVTPRAQ